MSTPVDDPNTIRVFMLNTETLPEQYIRGDPSYVLPKLVVSKDFNTCDVYMVTNLQLYKDMQSKRLLSKPVVVIVDINQKVPDPKTYHGVVRYCHRIPKDIAMACQNAILNYYLLVAKPAYHMKELKKATKGATGSSIQALLHHEPFITQLKESRKENAIFIDYAKTLLK
jgi:hypothetical protein